MDSTDSRQVSLACLGDSITRAQVSADYVEPLARRHGGALAAARFGVNGDFAYNLLQRLDPVIAGTPDLITVLIGTNDARAGLPGYPLDWATRRKQLPTRPSPGWFRDCLVAIVERLKAETDAEVGLLSLPVLGQDLDGPAAQASEAHSRVVAEVADAHRLAYLPLHEAQADELRRAGARPVPYPGATHPVLNGTVLRRFVLRRSLDAIARGRGLWLTTDHVHQNSRGAGIIADVIDGSDLVRRRTGRDGAARDDAG
jgi:lysophospholipase L1-like esterase